MPEAIPTPYDIVEIPHVPWEPGGFEWSILVGALVLGILLVRFATYRTRRKSGKKIVKLLLKEIELAIDSGDPTSIERISHVARRILEYRWGKELSTLSPNELRKLAETGLSEAHRTALLELATIEELVYEPPSEEHNVAVTEHLKRLAVALRVYVREGKKK